jgi:hypothetical protein
VKILLSSLVLLTLSLPGYASNTEYLKCNAVMTDEQSGNVFKKPFEINSKAFNDGLFYQDNGKGSTTMYYDSNKNRGDISIMVGPEVVVSGYFSCDK